MDATQAKGAMISKAHKINILANRKINAAPKENKTIERKISSPSSTMAEFLCRTESVVACSNNLSAFSSGVPVAKAAFRVSFASLTFAVPVTALPMSVP